MILESIRLRSSFGLTKAESIRYVTDYANRLCRNLDHAAFVDARDLDRRYGGLFSCIFESGSLVGFDDTLNSGYINDAHTSDDLDAAFTRTIVAAGHEFGHMRQCESNNPMLAVCAIVDAGNRVNYWRTYRHNRREIRAELSGLKQAEAELRDKLRRPDWEQLLVRYVNDAVARKGYFIDAPESGKYESMDGVYAAFKTAYDDAEKFTARYFAIERGSGDAFAEFVYIADGVEAHGNSAFDPEHVYAYNALRGAKTANDAEKIMAAVTLHLRPELAVEACGAKLPDLDLDTVVPPPGQSVPDSVKRLMSMDDGSDDRHDCDGPDSSSEQMDH